jgi:hypothetical protein
MWATRTWLPPQALILICMLPAILKQSLDPFHMTDTYATTTPIARTRDGDHVDTAEESIAQVHRCRASAQPFISNRDPKLTTANESGTGRQPGCKEKKRRPERE